MIGRFAKKNSSYASVKKRKSGRKNKYLDDEQMEWIQNLSNVTHMNPGRRGNVYIGIFNGKRKYKQKRFLLWIIGNLFGGITGKVNNPKFSDIF